MPIDPVYEPMLAAAAAAPPPPPGTDPLVAARNGIENAFQHAGGPTLPTEDRVIAGPDGNEVPVRIYRGTDAPGAGLLVFFHGGGFIGGSIASHDGTARELAAAAQCILVSVQYRLAPEHSYPAGLEDCLAAVVWAHDHAAELGADPDRLAIGGDSAGGNLTAVVAVANRDRGGPALVHQLLVYPVIDPACATASMTENATGYFLTADSMRFMWSLYLADPAQGDEPYVNPMRAAGLSGLPPATVLTAEFDPLRDEGEAYAEALAAAGVAVACRRFDGQVHGFFSMHAFAPAARTGTDYAAEALRTAFGVL